jgi:hypothetical protein
MVEEHTLRLGAPSNALVVAVHVDPELCMTIRALDPPERDRTDESIVVELADGKVEQLTAHHSLAGTLEPALRAVPSDRLDEAGQPTDQWIVRARGIGI